MLKKIIFSILIILAIAAAVWGYFFLKQIKKPKVAVINSLPANCDYVIETDNFFQLYKKLNETNLIWEELKQFDFIKKADAELFIIDSVLKSNEKIKKIIENNKVYFGAYTLKNEQQFLIGFNLPEVNYDEAANNFLKEESKSITDFVLPQSKEKAIKVQFKNNSYSFFVYINAGLVLISLSSELLDEAILSQNKSALIFDKTYTALEESAGKDVDIRVYLKDTYLNNFYAQLDTANSAFSVKLNALSGWTSMDIEFQSDEIQLNGFVEADTSRFFKFIKTQEPVELTFMNTVPKKCNSFVFLGISDYEKLRSSATNYNLKDIDFYNKKTDADIGTELNAIAGDEFALINFKDEPTVGLMEINNKENATKFLKQIADSLLLGIGEDSIVYLKNKNLFTIASGSFLIKPFNYCFLYNDYILFAETDSSLKSYISNIRNAGTFVKNEKFNHLAETNLNSETNFFIYADIEQSQELLKLYLPSKIKNALLEKPDVFTKFSSVGFQLTTHKNKILQQSYLYFSPKTKTQTLSLWETELDTTSSFIPQIVINHKTNGKELIVQDDANKIYLLSNTGKIIWKKELEGIIMSSIHQVDYYKNSKLQLLFNTPNYIHLIDRNGNYVEGYPVKTKHECTNGLSVFDYENTKEYRVLVACADKKIYNYNLNGKLVDGFDFEISKDTVTQPILFKRINQKDYLLAIDKSGNVYGTGRRGEKRLTLTNKLSNTKFNYYFDLGKDIEKSKFYFIDQETNEFKQLNLNNAMIAHAFDTDLKIKKVHFDFVNEDRLIDYILVDETGFQVMDDLGIRLVNYLSKSDILPEVKTILYENQLYFLVVDVGNNLRIITINGKEAESIPYNFSKIPIINQLNNDGNYFIIGNNKNRINCYEFRLN
jgi:hypothetical protein